MSLNKDPQFLRDIIMQHYDQPTNKVDDLKLVDGYINYHNKSASCIDDIDLYLKVDDNKIIDAKFYGVGCAISTSSTDIFCDIIKGKEFSYLETLLKNYYAMIKNEPYDEEVMEELIAFMNIHQQSNRKNCACIGADALSNLMGSMNEKK